jgi:Domain of unknown function (DUF756)
MTGAYSPSNPVLGMDCIEAFQPRPFASSWSTMFFPLNRWGLEVALAVCLEPGPGRSRLPQPCPRHGPADRYARPDVQVEAGRRLSATVATSSVGYEVEVHGPNGFYRRLCGGAVTGPEVTAAPVGSSQDLQLVITNAGPAHDLGRPRPRAPDDPAPSPGWSRHARDRRPHQRMVRRDDCLERRPTFRRQLAGHVENGRPSISDPTLAE